MKGYQAVTINSDVQTLRDLTTILLYVYSDSIVVLQRLFACCGIVSFRSPLPFFDSVACKIVYVASTLFTKK